MKNFSPTTFGGSIRVLNAAEVGKKLAELIETADAMHWSIAWASDFSLADRLLENRPRIRQIVVGTDFYQTDPSFLEKIASLKVARVASGVNGSTFHPKVYYFEKGRSAVALVGSANFTRQGTSTNSEVSLLLDGQVVAPEMRCIKDTVDRFWSDGKELAKPFLVSYRLQWTANRKHSKALETHPKVITSKDDAEHPSLLTWDWSEYVSKIKESKSHNIPGRLKILRKVRILFTSQNNFSDLDFDERKAIGGTFGPKETPAGDLGDFDWGWFGSMFGAGDFKNRLNENDRHLSNALDVIPIAGDVSEDNYKDFIKEFLKAFKDSEHVGGVPVASRLLSMKRPDIFLCVNQKNLGRLAKDLGFPKTKLDVDRYWDAVVRPVTSATWWQTRRPSGQQGQIWDGRAAMLDAIYYVP